MLVREALLAVKRQVQKDTAHRRPHLHALAEAEVNHEIDAEILVARPSLVGEWKVNRAEGIYPVDAHVFGVGKGKRAENCFERTTLVAIAELIVILIVFKLHFAGIVASASLVAIHDGRLVPDALKGLL